MPQPEQQREKRYEVRKINTQDVNESEVVSAWDSFQFAKAEVNRLCGQTGLFHFVRDTREETEQ